MPTTVERLQVEVSAKTAAARAELARMDATTARTASSGTKRMATLAKGLGLAFGGAAVVGGITKTIGLAMDFDKTMRQVGVQTGQSGKQLDNLGQLAKNMGQATIYSAKDAGEAMLNLAKGGLTAADIKAGALEQALRLAAAGGIDLESSAGIMANALSMFGLKAKDAGQVTTALAGAANASTASVDSLRMALSQVGSGARNSGLSIQETVAALAEFDQAGVKGSDAGTSLKTMLQRLVPSTKTAATTMKRLGLVFHDQHGNFLPLAQIAQNLHDKLANLSQVQRQQALNSIFGSDASRAASILMRGGASAVEHYTKAAKDQATTQKMANAAMKGASGAWENFKGTIETLAISVGQQALPLVTKLLNQGNDLLNSANQWGPGVAQDFTGIAHAAEGVAKVIEPLASMVVSLASGFQSLPGPVKSTAIEVGIAALVWPKLQSAAVGALTPIGAGLTSTSAKVKQFRSELSYTATRSQALQGALRGVAGPAGMGLLVAGAQSSNSAIKTLSQVGGGALMGFAAGGPIGAAIGGGAGLFAALASHMHDAAKAAAASKADYSGLAGTLDTLTGATTAATRAYVYDQLQRSKALGALAQYGISARTAVDAIMGQAKASKVVSAAIQGQVRDYKSLTSQIKTMEAARAQGLKDARAGQYGKSTANIPSQGDIDKLKAQASAERNVIDAVQKGMGSVKASTAAARAKARAVQDLTGKLHGIPKDVRTKIIQEGVDPTKRGIAETAKRYHLLPKQVKTLISAVGVETSVKGVSKVVQHLKDVGKTKPNLAPFNEAVRRSGAVADSDAKRSAAAIKGSLEKGPKDAKANLGNFTASIRQGAEAARGVASTGGHSVGAALSEGVISGFSGTGSRLAAEAAAAVRTAVASARAAGRIKSPSRVMRDKVGKPLADGVVAGIKARRHKLQESGKQMIQNVMAGIRQSDHDAEHTLKQVGKWARKAFSGKQEHAWSRRVHEATQRVRADYERLRSVTERLAKAQSKLSNIKQQRADFMSSISGGMTSQASVTNAGADAGSIATNLATQAGKVKEFAKMLAKLKKRGWADQIIRDIAAAGVEGGYDTAKALLAADAAQEKSINASYNAIYKTARDSAKSMGDAMYGSGIKAAAGVVAGLKRRQRDIKDQLLQIAESMADAIRRAVGLKGGGGHHRGGGGNGGPRHHHAGGGGSGAGSGAARTVIRRRDTVAARVGANGGAVHFHFKTYYPRSEPLSKTVNVSLQRAATLNLI